jgi:hypothetical protein
MKMREGFMVGTFWIILNESKYCQRVPADYALSAFAFAFLWVCRDFAGTSFDISGGQLYLHIVPQLVSTSLG